MRAFTLVFCALIFVIPAMPAAALECSNAGAAPTTAPDDTLDGEALACGGSAIAGGDGATALGFGSNASGASSTALGFAADAAGISSIALGPNANSGGSSSTALGFAANSAGLSSTALGYRAFVNQADSIVIGAIAGLNGATAYGKVGIGTPAPLEAVDVERSAAAARFQLTSLTGNASEAPQFIQRRARGTTAAPGAVQNNDNLGLFSFRGYNGVSMGGSRATITAQAAGTFSASSTPTRLIFATTPAGQTAPQSVLVITPDGKVQVNGVNLNVPDYVFEEDYELMPPNELRAFIDRNGHLPGIANAEQINAEGLDLAGSQMGLLQKVEELTLYMLEQESRLEAQQERIEQIDSLQERVAQLETQLSRALAALE